jgi:hypothetical protein
MLMQVKIGLVFRLLGINNAFEGTLKKIILSQGTQTHYQASILKSWEHKSIIKKNHSKSGNTNPLPSKHSKVMGTQIHYQKKNHSKSGNTNPLPSKHSKVMGTQTHHKKNHKWVTDPH